MQLEIFLGSPPFDPLGISSRRARLQALSVFMATIVLSLALAESVSAEGVLVLP